MDPTALGVHGSGWLRLAVGLVLLALPGVATADRLIPGRRGALVLAPVLSMTVLPLSAMVLDLVFQVPIRSVATPPLAVALALLIGRPRVEAAVRRLLGTRQVVARAVPARTPTHPTATADLLAPARHPRPRRELVGLMAAILLVVVVQFLPHMPGQAPRETLDPQPPGPWGILTEPPKAYPELMERFWSYARGGGIPYPLHVDEHIHLAYIGEVGREGTVDIADPYTGRPYGFDLFSVEGLRQERGFHVAMLQAHHLTGVALPAMAKALPALWTGVLAAAAWWLLRPAPGALAGAAFVAAIPTTVRMLGPGFLVPSAFALPWILLTVAVALRATGTRRFAGLVLAITGATFMHLVLGTVCVAVGILATLLRRGRPSDRAALLGATLLPLLWIVPILWDDAVRAVTGEHDLPFAEETILLAGLPLYAAAALGAGVAWWRWPLSPATGDDAGPKGTASDAAGAGASGTAGAAGGPDNSGDASGARSDETATGSQDVFLPHRILAVLAVLVVASLAGSVVANHRSDATYSRLVPTFVMCCALLAGAGVARAGRAAAGWGAAAWLRIRRQPASGALLAVAATPSARPSSTAAACATLALALLVLAPAIQGNQHDQFYRVFDAASWNDLAILSQQATPQDVVLMHPWQAPLANALTGARPHAVLYPGAPPVAGADYAAYLEGNADAGWLAQRGITIAVGPEPPGDAHAPLGGRVHRVSPP